MLSAVYAECRKQTDYAECRYAECRYDECRGAKLTEVKNAITASFDHFG
jgi:hypothetical protein